MGWTWTTGVAKGKQSLATIELRRRRRRQPAPFARLLCGSVASVAASRADFYADRGQFHFADPDSREFENATAYLPAAPRSDALSVCTVDLLTGIAHVLTPSLRLRCFDLFLSIPIIGNRSKRTDILGALTARRDKADQVSIDVRLWHNVP